MRIAITGASGLVGKALVQYQNERSVEVLPMVRSNPQPGEVLWSPYESFDASPLEGIDALVHLAGESIVGRWTASKRQRIRRSRVEATQNLCHHLLKLSAPPKTMLCASAIGYYGHRQEDWVDETSAPGQGFLASVAVDWERATTAATEAGIRVCNCRFGMILSAAGGALKTMLPLFRWGCGGRLGSGQQFWSWMAINDCVAALDHCLQHEELRGPVNFVSPQPVRNREFTRVLAATVHRPALLPAPAFALRTLLGDMADELLLASTRVACTKLHGSGFQFRFPDLPSALGYLLRPTT
ncbi:MAG: hypothetical protein KatS3mg111_3041 [Pirellulaceae bacterium]|nr:MAG: hypothetical protein KatS3mg111_3041 [Pirellulaceae bacterium]